ncbi:MAG: hypothetical protein IKU85_05305 [Bacteroidaceae bacterium]|nr:hypothetical protein [Bacteroidaceae bacterium]
MKYKQIIKQIFIPIDSKRLKITSFSAKIQNNKAASMAEQLIFRTFAAAFPWVAGRKKRGLLCPRVIDKTIL